MFPQTCIQNIQGYHRNLLKMVNLDGKEETDMVAERIAGCIWELKGMEGGEEALKTTRISYVQPNWFADGDWWYLLARLRGYFSSIWKISKGFVVPTSAKCNSVRKPHAILPDTPGDLTSASKYF